MSIVQPFLELFSIISLRKMVLLSIGSILIYLLIAEVISTLESFILVFDKLFINVNAFILKRLQFLFLS